MSILLIAISNPIRGADRVGLEIAKRLEHIYDTLVLHQLSTEIVLKLTDIDEVIFADASYGTPRGAIACAIDDSNTTITHKVSIDDFMRFACEYHDRDIEYSVYSILSDEFEYSDRLPCYLSSSIDTIVEYLSK
jgi:Ni,Fe-hydrogenase maturation factor